MSMKQQYGAQKDNYHKQIMIKSTIILVVCILLTLICLVPIYILIVNATHTHTELAENPSQLFFGGALGENMKILTNDIAEDAGKALRRVARQYSSVFNIGRGYLNSLIIAGCTTLLTVFFSALTAYGLVVYDFKLKGPAYTFIIGVMMIPVQVSSAGFVRFMYSLNLINNFIPLIIPAIAAPAVIFFMHSSLKSTFPLSIVEAARIDGCSEFRTFMSVALPLMKPAMAVQAIFAFVQNWNNYYTQNMILKNDKMMTVPIMVSKVLQFDKDVNYGVNYLCIALSIVPIVVVYVALSKFIIAGVALGGVKE
ncbi:MAG: carbohydrate ABC transporter permease [Oscillospiraceae bacterium]|nr:carbohydrate ABC transporter permease [Oscillospiraceae bacterium]